MRERRLTTEAILRYLPAIGVLITWTVLMFDGGGFFPGSWLPAGLVLAGLLVLAVLGGGTALPAAGPARSAFFALAAFTAWCFLSILWSDASGATWEAANLLLVALLGAWILTLTPWDAKSANAYMLAFSVAAAVACLVGLLAVLGETSFVGRFVGYRFAPPLDYPNTSAAFAIIAAIPALLLAVRPDASIPAKAFGQGLATFLAAYALLPQSRGSIIGGIAALTALAILVPYRWRLLMHVGLLGVFLVAVAGPIGEVYTVAAKTGKPGEALEDAAFTIGGATLLAIAAGALLAMAQQRFSLPREQRGTARRAGFGLTGLAALLVLAVVVVKAGAIGDQLSDQWRSLKNPGVEFAGKQANANSGRLSSVDPLERYDYWRVSSQQFLGAPLWGGGAGSFEHEYGLERRYPKVSRFPHNLGVKVLGETGLVGVALMGAFLVLIGLGVVRARRKTVAERMVLASGVTILVYYFAHGLFDWLEGYPVLNGPALAFPLVALAATAREPHLSTLAPAPSARRRRSELIAGLAAAAVAVLAVVSLLMPWLSLRYRDRAVETWRTNPGVAFRDLDRAASVDPLTPEPGILRGVIGLRSGDLVAAQEGFEQALDREETWLPHFGLGVVAAAQGDRPAARGRFERAESLNRLDPVLPEVTARALKQSPVLPGELIRDVLVSPFFDRQSLN